MAGPVDERVPAIPLVMVLERIARRYALEHSTNAGNQGLYALCERAGINERQLHRWRYGEIMTVSLDDADRILLATDRLWFDVFTPETVRKPILEVRVYGYKHMRKKSGPVTYRRWVRTVRYGDAGTDWDALERVRVLFEGADELLEAAA